MQSGTCRTGRRVPGEWTKAEEEHEAENCKLSRKDVSGPGDRQAAEPETAMKRTLAPC